MNSEKFSRYNSADYLKTDEDIAGFLEAAIEEGGDDPAFMAHARSVIARARARNRAPGTQTDEATDELLALLDKGIEDHFNGRVPDDADEIEAATNDTK